MASEYVRPQILVDIRKAVVQQHQAALQALALLERYMAQDAEDTGVMAQLAAIHRLMEPATRSRSIRERVLAAIPDAGATVDAIRAATGLSKRQIRGVLYAPEIRELTTNHRASGENRFYHRKNPITGDRVRH